MAEESNTPNYPWSDLPAYRAEFRARNPIPPFEAVVLALADRAQWLLWRYEPGEKPEKKPRKMPYYAGGGRRVGDQGSDRDRQRLTTYAIAAEAARNGDFDGVGFAFLPGDGLIGIDLDGMIDPDTGEVDTRCAEIIKACDSYTELSPSGKGVHIICLGETETFKSNKVGIEVFSGRQYFTFTAKHWQGSPLIVRAIDNAVLRRLRKTVKPDKPKPTPAPAAAATPPPASGTGRERSAAETVALVEEALQHLDADDYQQWIDVGLACKAGLGDNAGYLVWDQWSARSAKYAGADDTAKRWQGFKPTQLTLGTVFGLAEQSGWKSPWAKARENPRKRKRRPAVEEPPPPGEMPPDTAQAADGAAPAPEYKRPFFPDLVWKKDGLSSCLANVHQILTRLPDWKGVIAFDEFAQRTVKLKPPPYEGGAIGEWDSTDDSRTAIYLSQFDTDWNFTPTSATVAEAVEVIARENAFHPVREWLESLPPWDGTHRLGDWLHEHLGVPLTEYSKRVGTWYLQGMVARVMEPGVKFDYCLVLEGTQGKGKSSALRVLGGEWYADTDLDLHNKDSMSALRGKWLYEFAELGSVARSESLKQKSFLSRQIDEFRPVYGRREIKCPRQVVFAGTTNEWEWNKDPTGGRRFWPVECSEINLDGLGKIRDLLFAEALHRYRRGKRMFPTPDEQKEIFDPEQLKVEIQESLVDGLHDWVYERARMGVTLRPFSLFDVMRDCLKLDASKMTRDMQTRVGSSLRKLGCSKIERRNGMVRFLYVPPELSDEEKARLEHEEKEKGARDVGF